MGESCYVRRLSDLLQEQQEPFLLAGGASLADACRRRLLAFCHRRAAVSNKSRALGGLGAAVFCGGAVRRALLAGCFSCGARQSFRRLRHAGAGDIAAACDDDDEECARQLSPVSVLDLDIHSDDESSPILGVGRHREKDDESPSTSGKSSPPPPPEQNSLDAAAVASPCFTFYEAGKNCKAETTRSKLEEQMIISSWERISGDISRIPVLVELDLTGSAQQWRRLREEEASQVGASIEAMIFEEMRVEAVRDMMLVA